MTIREEIVYNLMNIMTSGKNVKERIIIELDKYEITERSFELITMEDEDFNQKCRKRFVIAKTIAGCSEKTIHYYEDIINKFSEKIAKNYKEVTVDDVRLYFALRKKESPAITNVTLNNERRNLSSFFEFLRDEEIITRNPAKKVGKFKETKKKKEAFNDMEIERMRSVCKNNREKALMEFLLSTGCRVSETANTKIEDLEQDGSIEVRGKGDKYRKVYLNAKAKISIEEYMKEREDENPYLFPGGIHDMLIKGRFGRKDAYNWYKKKELVDETKPIDKGSIECTIRNLGKRAGCAAHPHKFRRTAATYALRRGMPLHLVSKMLGHESVETTQIYLDISEDELEAAHKKYVV